MTEQLRAWWLWLSSWFRKTETITMTRDAVTVFWPGCTVVLDGDDRRTVLRVETSRSRLVVTR